MYLSVISPVYNASEIVDELVKRIKEEVIKITEDFEIILVDDGSIDNSWEKVKKNCEIEKRIKGIKLSRNFGQHYAITAGLSKSTGENVVLMDCDLQDDPAYIQELLKLRKVGYDIIFTRRLQRKHGLIKSINSRLYNLLFDFFSERKYDVNAGSLTMFSRQVTHVFLQLKDKDRLYLQMLKWVGFNTTTLAVEHKPRFAGKSTYSFTKLLKMGVQGWTSHSTKLLKFSTVLGFFLASISIFLGISIIIRYLLYDLQPGWPSIIVSILFSTGVILLSIGITGIYVGKIFEQVKDRPIFIIEKEVNINE